MTTKNNNKVYYRITRNSDTTEGRGPVMDTRFAFYNKEDALRFVASKYYADNFGVMGTPGSKYDIDERPLHTQIYSSFEECMLEIGQEISREKALAKLTPAERKLLGLE